MDFPNNKCAFECGNEDVVASVSTKERGESHHRGDVTDWNNAKGNCVCNQWFSSVRLPLAVADRKANRFCWLSGRHCHRDRNQWQTRRKKKTEIQFIRYAPDFCLPYILSSQMHFNEGFWFWKMLSGPGKDNLPITRNPSGIWDSWEERWQKSAPLSDYDRDRQSCLHFFCKLVVQVRSILHFKPLWRMGKC